MRDSCEVDDKIADLGRMANDTKRPLSAIFLKRKLASKSPLFLSYFLSASSAIKGDGLPASVGSTIDGEN